MTEPRKILVMDDDEDVRFLVEILLGKLGFVVESVINGEQAITKYGVALESGNRYAAVILDLNIPGSKGGAQVAEAILAIDPTACLFVSSGNDNDPVMLEAGRYGFAGKLPKPFLYADAVELVKKIQ